MDPLDAANARRAQDIVMMRDIQNARARNGDVPTGGGGCCLYKLLILVAAVGFIGFVLAHLTSGNTKQCTGGSSCNSTATAQAQTPSVDQGEPGLTGSDLQQIHLQDKGVIETSLVEHWVPQLASYQAANELGNGGGDQSTVMAQLVDLHGYGALLLSSDDYVSNYPGYWVVIAPDTFDSSDGALGWCDSKGLDRDHCYARFITHDSSITELSAH